MIKEGIHINAIYQHYKGDYYRVKDIAFHHSDDKDIVIYNKCDINGIYISIRNNEVIVEQPFYREIYDFKAEVRHPQTQEFVKRFKFIKQL